MLRRTKIVLIACQPKTASTFLTRLIADSGNGKVVSLVPSHGRREQELSRGKIARYRFTKYRYVVAQHHVRYSRHTENLINKYGINIVVLTRNLFDAVASLRDHNQNESYISPIMHLDSKLANTSKSELERTVAMLDTPWYLNFYMSWREYPNALFVKYEEIREDANKLFNRIFEYFCLGASREYDYQYEKIKLLSLFNVGKTGRGAYLNPEALQHFKDLVDIYAKKYNDPCLI